jgi:hypothetical protein
MGEGFMLLSRFRKFLYAGALLAVAPLMAQAGHTSTAGCDSGCAAGAGGCAPAAPADGCAPAAPAVTYKTIRETVMVPEKYMTTRTTYKYETKNESYTAYKYETVNETKTRNVTVMKKVTETVMVPKTYTVKVPVMETVTTYETRYRTETYTEMVSKTVDKGHYEYKEVPAGPSILDRFKGLCAKKSCDPCAPACDPCPKMKTVKCWVPCCVTECCPVTKCRKVKECVPCTKQVCTYKCETKCEMVPTCVTKCIPETKCETYTECKKVCVPYQATKCVKVCVPVTEQCEATRMVCKVIEKQVAVDPAPACGDACGSTSCAPACEAACEPACGDSGCCEKPGFLKGLFGGLRGRLSKGCCN